MLCAPNSKGIGCRDSRDPDEYCFNNSCSDHSGFCKVFHFAVNQS